MRFPPYTTVDHIYCSSSTKVMYSDAEKKDFRFVSACSITSPDLSDFFKRASRARSQRFQRARQQNSGPDITIVLLLHKSLTIVTTKQLFFFSRLSLSNFNMFGKKRKLFLVACYKTLELTLSIHQSVDQSICHQVLFSSLIRF